jgi:hypothetical protein
LSFAARVIEKNEIYSVTVDSEQQTGRFLVDKENSTEEVHIE